MTSWREERRNVANVERVDLERLHELTTSEPGVQVLDVREADEWDAGHITGSTHVPYHDLDGIPSGLDGGRPIAVVCSSGQRAALGASLLLRHGAQAVLHVVDGGVGTWERRGWPVER